MTMELSAGAAKRRGAGGWRWSGRIFLILLLGFTVMPMIWMFITSLKTGFAAMQYPPQWWPAEPTLENYWRLIDPSGTVGRDFIQYFWNSIWVSTLTTILAVVVAVPAAYAFSRFRFPGRNFLFFAVLLRNMFPAVVFLVPLFILMKALGLVNTHGSLILTYLTFGLPLAIWLLKGFYDNIPVQLEQAARIDGATRFQAFLLIVTFVLINILLSLVKQRSSAIERIIDDVPMIIVQHGRPLHDRMNKVRIDQEDVLESARESHGLKKLADIRYAVLERDGKISIIPA